MSPGDVRAYRRLAAEVLMVAVNDARRLKEPGSLTGFAGSAVGRLWLASLNLDPDEIRRLARR